jgi:hypothetical protein
MLLYQDLNGLMVHAFDHVKEDLGHFYHVILDKQTTSVVFQNGPVPIHGVNGVTNEALLTILIHRTNILNEQFPCEENKVALGHMQKALESFNARTKNRVQRNVEGKNLL